MWLQGEEGVMNYQKGSVLAATLIILVMLGTMGVAIIYMTSESQLSEILDQESQEAFYLAEAGVNYARINPFSDGVTQNFSGGSFTLDVNAVGNGLLQVRSVGKKGDASAVLNKVVQAGGKRYPDDVVLLLEGGVENTAENPKNVIDSSVYFHQGVGSTVNAYQTTDDNPIIDYWGNPVDSIQFLGANRNVEGWGSFVEVPDDDALDLTTAGTLSAWIYADVLNGLEGIIYKGNGSDPEAYSLRYIDNGNIGGESVHQVLVLTVNGGGRGYAINSGRVKILPGRWYHVAGTWSANGDADGPDGMRLYVNGSEVSYEEVEVEAPVNDDPLYIGTQALDRSNQIYFEGLMTDILVVSRALRAAEVESLFKSRELFYQFSSLELNNLTTNDDTIHKFTGKVSSGVSTNSDSFNGDGSFEFNGTGYLIPEAPWINLDLNSDRFTLAAKVKPLEYLDEDGNESIKDGIIAYSRYLGTSASYTDDLIIKLEVINSKIVFSVGPALNGNSSLINGGISATVEDSLEINKWYNLIAVYQGDERSVSEGSGEDWCELAVNGALSGKNYGYTPKIFPNSVFPQYFTLVVGNGFDKNNEGFYGLIDEVEFFDRIFINSDIAESSRKALALWLLDDLTLENRTVANEMSDAFYGVTEGTPISEIKAGKVGLRLDGETQFAYGEFETGVGAALNDGYPMSFNVWMYLDGEVGASDWGIFSLDKADTNTSSFWTATYLNKNTSSLTLQSGNAVKNELLYNTALDSIDPAQWFMVTAVYYDAYRMGLYLNGVKVVDSDVYNDYKNKNVTVDDAFNRWLIGRWAGSAGDTYFKGWIRKVSVYNFSLTDGEISTLYSDD